eukprot:GHVT01005106.1.p1 GENE.GHVT01005106.1~~GHVT01005106.1.p1  ORF type:complete len:324 (-),score=50.81 GHVT01005106.1:1536-2507(-)
MLVYYGESASWDGSRTYTASQTSVSGEKSISSQSKKSKKSSSKTAAADGSRLRAVCSKPETIPPLPNEVPAKKSGPGWKSVVGMVALGMLGVAVGAGLSIDSVKARSISPPSTGATLTLTSAASPPQASLHETTAHAQQFVDDIALNDDLSPSMDITLWLPAWRNFPEYFWKSPSSPVSASDRCQVVDAFKNSSLKPWCDAPAAQRTCLATFAKAATFAPELFNYPKSAAEWVVAIDRAAVHLVKAVGYIGVVQVAKALYIHYGFKPNPPNQPGVPDRPVPDAFFFTVLVETISYHQRQGDGTAFGVKKYMDIIEAIRRHKAD